MVKEKAILYVSLLISLSLVSCSRDYPIFEESEIRFPLSSGNWWALSREWEIVSNPPSQESLFSRDSIYWEIVDRSNFYGYNSYVLKNELYTEGGDSYYSFDWYTDNWDGKDGLYHIGSCGGGVTPVKSKYKLLFRGKEFNSPEEIFEWVQGFKSCKEDTHVKIPPRRVLEYPLVIGKEWVAFNNPWLRTRKVVDRETVTTPAGSFSCYKIEVSGEIFGEEDAVWYDRFSNEGLVKRYIWFKGEQRGPDGEIRGTWEGTNIYLLEDYFVGDYITRNY